MKEERIYCSNCAKPVSNIFWINTTLIIRAWIECPECIEKADEREEVRDLGEND